MELLRNNPYILAIGAVAVIDLVLLIILGWRFGGYQKKQAELLAGEGGANLQEIILGHKKLLASYNKNLRELGKILEELVENNKLNVQKVGIVRFNPFADTGGNMSFAMALLDGHNNGIVISSLHSREATRIYAKPVERGESKYPLTNEEKEAILKGQSKI